MAFQPSSEQEKAIRLNERAFILGATRAYVARRTATPNTGSRLRAHTHQP